MRAIRHLMLLLIALFCTACSCSPTPSVEIISRSTGPAGDIEAVLVRYNYHATVDYIYSLYLWTPDEKQDFMDDDAAMLTADKVDDMTMQWIAPNVLEVSYQKARIFRFTNWRYRSNEDLKTYEVRLKLLSDYSLDR